MRIIERKNMSTKKTPLVVAKTDFKLSLKNRDRFKKNDNLDIDYVSTMLDYFSNDEKRVMNMIDYFTGKINKHENINLVLENGKYATKEELEKRKKYISEQFNNSNVWQIILSVDKDFVDKNMKWKDLEKELATKVLPKFFKHMGFIDSKKMCYQFSLHCNTDHPHFHIAFMEREPNTCDIYYRKIYRREGKIPIKSINFLKKELTATIEREKKFNPLATDINKNIDNIKDLLSNDNLVLYRKKDIFIEEKINRLGELLNERNISYNSRIKFNSIKDDEIKTLTKEIKKDLFSRNNEFYISESEYNESIKKMNKYLFDLGVKNRISKKEIDTSYTKYKDEYLNNYIYNAIVNHARYSNNSNKNFTSNDLFQSIILLNYMKNGSINKRGIISNYLYKKGLNRFKNKNSIYNSLRRIKEKQEQELIEIKQMLKTGYEKGNEYD